ncbi:MAG TPA: hypothetical protein VN664_04605, partial [Burkholderiales bacterium]|nr:hypothetical protein [Burkholderiales bacterium]
MIWQRSYWDKARQGTSVKVMRLPFRALTNTQAPPLVIRINVSALPYSRPLIRTPLSSRAGRRSISRTLER